MNRLELWLAGVAVCSASAVLAPVTAGAQAAGPTPPPTCGR